MGLCASVPVDEEVNGGKRSIIENAPKDTAATTPAETKAVAPRKTESDAKASEERKSAGERPKNYEIAKQLANVPLLAKLSYEERAILGGALQERRFRGATKIVVEGEGGNEFFIIKDGVCVVTRKNPETKEDIELCELKSGDYFGETALLTNSTRGATIAAKSDVVCLTLGRQEFQKLFGEDRLQVNFVKRAAISAEAYNPDAKENKMALGGAPEGAVTKKTKEQQAAVMRAIEKNILFGNLDVEQRGEIVNSMWIKHVQADTSLIKQGELGEHFYVVESGAFEVFLSKDGGTPMKVASRGPGTTFGELALMYNAPRAATVTATVDSTVWVVDRWTFRRILTNVENQKMKEYELFLRGVPEFGVLLDYERSRIAEALEEVSFPANHDIFRQGDEGDTFFILKRGELHAKIQTDPSLDPVEVARYKAGDYFGERALVKNEKRAATITTLTACECLYLTKQAFALLLGPLEDIFRARVEGYTKDGRISMSMGVKVQQQQQQAAAAKKPEEKENFLMTDIKLTDLKTVGILGKGSFGVVTLVKDKAGTTTYALKQVSKSQIVQLGQQEHIMSEKRVMAQLNYPFLIRLFATFNDKNCLYFLLEPSLGGELFSVLRAKTFFDENTARFMAAGVILAFDYMHNKGIIYRDLKPENLLLDAKGYIKITDFGFAKQVGDGRTWTLCGTPDYLAPEVVSGQGHGKGVDWWTLGILIYEMLASYPPFYDDDPMKTYGKIMAGQIAFPMHFSAASQDLIRKLLHPKPTKRLGVVKGGAKLIKEHPWFDGFDWDGYESQKMKAPIVLPVKDMFDLSNFEEYPEEDLKIEDYHADPKHGDWDKDF